jgi:nitrous oxidase accessory protein NosD
MRSWKSLIGAAAAAGGLLAQPLPAQAAGSHVLVVHPGQSIQAAIDRAQPGNTIVVKPGTYHETLLITKDRLTLRGEDVDDADAVLMPPSPAPPPNQCTAANQGLMSGICVLGTLDAMGNVTRNVVGDRVRGLKIEGFPANGVFGFGTDRLTVDHVVALDDGEYGIARFFSTRTRFTDNQTAGNQEAGLYVGDSPDADTVVSDNRTWNNGFGVFVRHSHEVLVTHNRSWGNCIGVFVLDDGEPGGAGDIVVKENTVNANNKFCPADEEHHAPPLSGAGIVLLGAVRTAVVDNDVNDNNSGGTFVSGGIVLKSAGIFGGSDVIDDTVRDNDLHRNQPADLVWDGSGHGNRFVDNDCRTSIPSGLCP